MLKIFSFVNFQVFFLFCLRRFFFFFFFFFLPFSLGFLSTGGGLLSMELMLEGEAMLLELEVWGINVRKNTDMHSRMRCFIVWSDLGVLIVCSL